MTIQHGRTFPKFPLPDNRFHSVTHNHLRLGSTIPQANLAVKLAIIGIVTMIDTDEIVIRCRILFKFLMLHRHKQQ